MVHGTGSWSFDNNFAKNVVIFGVNNSSLFHTVNCKNKFSVLGEGPFMIVPVLQRKRLELTLVKQSQSFD